MKYFLIGAIVEPITTGEVERLFKIIENLRKWVQKSKFSLQCYDWISVSFQPYQMGRSERLQRFKLSLRPNLAFCNYDFDPFYDSSRLGRSQHSSKYSKIMKITHLPSRQRRFPPPATRNSADPVTFFGDKSIKHNHQWEATYQEVVTKLILSTKDFWN